MEPVTEFTEKSADNPVTEESSFPREQAIFSELNEYLETDAVDVNPEPGLPQNAEESGFGSNQEEQGTPNREQVEEVSQLWRSFVDEVSRSANASLVSLLRNAVVLELTEENLVIGFQNIKLFSKEKQVQIESTARSFFNQSIQVSYRESRDGLDDSIMIKHDLAQAKASAAIQEKAGNDLKIREILKVFPNATIESITILEEKQDNGKTGHEGSA